MTMSITIEEATTSLLDLLDRVSKGEEITILKDGQEIARLVPALPVLPPRVPGTAAGMITIAPDFDEPLPDDIMSDIYFTCDSVGDQGEISFLSMLWSCWHTILR